VANALTFTAWNCDHGFPQSTGPVPHAKDHGR
jgi:hypothetical protein